MRFRFTWPAMTAVTLLCMAGTAWADGPIAKLPWLHEGLQLTYTWGASAGAGLGGVGYSQTTIACIDGDKVVVTSQAFAKAGPLGNNAPVPLMGATTTMVQATNAGDFWMDPAQLATMHGDPDQGVSVTSETAKMAGQTVKAVRIQVRGSASYTDHLYDLKTGLCLHFDASGQGSATEGDFVAMRDLAIPWSQEATPDWVATIKALHYRGDIEFRGALPQVPNVLTIDMTTAGRGPGWIQVDSVLNSQMQGAPPALPSKSQIFYGRSQFAGLWASPKALAQLKTGQVLDQDPVTQMKTIVAKADNDSVTISSANAGGEIDSQFDKHTGVLIGSSFYNVMAQQLWTVRLQSRE